MMMAQNDSGILTVLKQTAWILLLSTVAVGVSLPLYYLISKGGFFQWSLMKFALGAVYGMLLGVGNFFAMALSMILLTATALDAKEGKARAQSSYLFRQFFVIGLAVVGCLIPIFHIVAVLGSLALTQLVVVIYSLIGSLVAMKNNPPLSGKPSNQVDAVSPDDTAVGSFEKKDEE